MNQKVLLIGGGGYVGTELQKFLVENNFSVRVYDSFWYEDGIWDQTELALAAKIEYIRGDVRDLDKLEKSLADVNSVIHLACISNDPSYELNPTLAKSINFEAFRNFIPSVLRSKVDRFIFASSSSVYGVKSEPNVTEDLVCEPRTDYSKFKVLCEEIIVNELSDRVPFTIIRPSTVCGASKRQRFDLVVNALTISALAKKSIRVDGGEQFRPNLHIKDMNRAYLTLLQSPVDTINEQILNVAGENLSVKDIALKVQQTLNNGSHIEYAPVVDDRSYRVSGEKIQKLLNFSPEFTVQDAINDIASNYLAGKYSNVFDDKYYNLKVMKSILGK